MPSSEVMHKWKKGELHSGSKEGPKVKNQKQAVAIMLSEKRNEAKHGGVYTHSHQRGGEVDSKLKGGGPVTRKDTSHSLQHAREQMEKKGTVGLMHKKTGTPQGQKIPLGKLEAKKAEGKRTGNVKLEREAQFALNFRGKKK